MKLRKASKQSRPSAQPIQNTFFPNSPSHQMKLCKASKQSRLSAQPIQNTFFHNSPSHQMRLCKASKQSRPLSAAHSKYLFPTVHHPIR